MKKLLIIAWFICLIFPSNGQPTEKTAPVIGFTSSASILDYTIRGYLEPYVALGTGSNQLLIAPTMLVGSNLGYQSPQSPRLTGARIGYRFWPGSLNEKWDFYLSADLRLQRLKDIWDANVFDETISEYQALNLKSIELTAENYVGYGLVFNINHHFQINQGVGLGWYLSKLNSRAVQTNIPVESVLDYRGYDNVGFLWNISLGVSYRL